MSEYTELLRLKAEYADMKERLKVYKENQEASRNRPNEYYFWADRIKMLRQEMDNKWEYIMDFEDYLENK